MGANRKNRTLRVVFLTSCMAFLFASGNLLSRAQVSTAELVGRWWTRAER